MLVRKDRKTSIMCSLCEIKIQAVHVHLHIKKIENQERDYILILIIHSFLFINVVKCLL